MDIINTVLYSAKVVGVSGNLLLAICSHESNDFKYNYVAMDNGSPSYGACQVKYFTAFNLGFRGKPMDLNKLDVNSYWAARYLKYQLERYDNDEMMATAAYNSGSYNPSKVLGCPRNLKYIKSVQSKLPYGYRNSLNCGYKSRFARNN